MKGEMNRVIMVYVDSYENDIPKGRFCIAADREVQTFESLSQLLKKISAGLDKAQFPQAFDQIRMFHDPRTRTVENDQNVNNQPGAAATFAIRILFRQNASWQGSLKWIEGAQEESFRSVLEMILLMDNALGYTRNK